MSYLIAEKLNNAPAGTKLYSPMLGEVSFSHVSQNELIIVVIFDYEEYTFNADGTWNHNGEVMLFPSKDNRDWTTFKLSDEIFKIGDYVEVYGKAYKVRCIEEFPFGVKEINYELMPLGDYMLINASRSQLKKIERFDYKYLHPWEKVISRVHGEPTWVADIFSFYDKKNNLAHTIGSGPTEVLPFNNETRGLLGTSNAAPEFYSKAWEETND